MTQAACYQLVLDRKLGEYVLPDGWVVKHVYFVAETKGSMSSMEFRKIEETKIECARKFFSRITSERVRYGVVSSYAKLMELVQQ